MVLRWTPALVTLVLVAALASASCGGKARATTCKPSGTELRVEASGRSFHTACLAVPASQAFTVQFTNKDPFGHNLTVRKEGTVLFAVVAAPGKTVTEEQRALAPGTYEFLCTIHPSMNGTFVAK